MTLADKSIKAEGLTFRLSLADPETGQPDTALARIKYELDRCGIAAHFAAEPGLPGTKAVADLLPLLVVAVPIVSEARKLVQILTAAKTSRGLMIESTVEDGRKTIIIKHARPEDLPKVVEGHFGIAAPDSAQPIAAPDSAQPIAGPDGAAGRIGA